MPGGALLALITSCQIAASIEGAYKHIQVDSLMASKENDRSECSFANAFKRHAWADTGNLGCEVYETCVEDQTSSLGGRCSRVNEMAPVQRELSSCQFANGTGGYKCYGWMSCMNVEDVSQIGCGSCNGFFSCWEG